MASPEHLVLQRDRHLKWRALDRVEWLLMVLCGLSIAGFSLAVLLDIITRTIQHPWLWLQEVTSALFIYGAFLGMAVATRRADHLMLTEITGSMRGAVRLAFETFNRLVVLAVGLCLLWFGWTNFLHGFGSFRMPSLTPLAWYYLPIPFTGLCICLFVVEQLGEWLASRLRSARVSSGSGGSEAMMLESGWILLIMAGLFLGLGYAGVPVPFALMAGVFAATAMTPISMLSMVGQLFNGLDSEALLAVPFFLLVGQLMTSADVTRRMIVLAQTLVGHFRGGLAQVVTVFSMFFAGISGSSTADVAVLSRTVAPEMDREGYDKGFTAALIAAASTMANLIPPSIMAVVYGATGNVSIAGLFLGGVVPGFLVGIGLMIYSHFFGPTGVQRRRATFPEFSCAAARAVLPLMIPVIIMGGILSGWFTPTEAGMAAVAYIVLVVIPVLRPGHIRLLPMDFVQAGLLYAIPMSAVAGASCFGWMLAYLRGPDVVATWIEVHAGTDPRMILFLLVGLFVIVGDFVDAVPAIIIFMPIITRLADLGGINPVHMGVTIITTLVFGLLTPPYGLSLLMAAKFCNVKFSTAMLRSLPLYIVFFATIAFCILFPSVVLWLPKTLLPESVGCFKAPEGSGYICPE